MSGTNRAPGLVGALILSQLVVVRALASVTDGRVLVSGRELRWECWLGQQSGLPCPTCGLTRGVLLTLHGRLGEAWQQNPAGLLLVFGLVLLGLALVYLAFYRARRTPHAAGALHRRIRVATKVYARLLVAVLFAHWFVELATR